MKMMLITYDDRHTPPNVLLNGHPWLFAALKTPNEGISFFENLPRRVVGLGEVVLRCTDAVLAISCSPSPY